MGNTSQLSFNFCQLAYQIKGCKVWEFLSVLLLALVGPFCFAFLGFIFLLMKKKWKEDRSWQRRKWTLRGKNREEKDWKERELYSFFRITSFITFLSRSTQSVIYIQASLFPANFN